MQHITYPFDAAQMENRQALKKSLQEKAEGFIPKRIAVLGGSTTDAIVEYLEIFLLNEGIAPTFYQCPYNQYWQEGVFGSHALNAFCPEMVFIHTTSRNVGAWPDVHMGEEEILALLEEETARFAQLWDALYQRWHCPIIQNNFERPSIRLLGNADVATPGGHSQYVCRLNQYLYQYAQIHNYFFIHDIDFLAASYGLARWADTYYWYMFKYALAVPAIPEFSFSLAAIIKSLLGKNKKALVLDLDGTLWGGEVGEAGAAGIAIGADCAQGQPYTDFQKYIKQLKKLGVVLHVCSKNEQGAALAGLAHPAGTLRAEDFASIRANWHNKNENILDIAHEQNLGADSFVFVDDNPAERELVRGSIPGIGVPELQGPCTYVQTLDRNGFFEVTHLSAEDAARGAMYSQNAIRARYSKTFESYKEYLQSLVMQTDINPFEEPYLQRIAQLSARCNQFNLVANRYTLQQVAQLASDKNMVALYGTLRDKFGDNGVVTAVVARVQGEAAYLCLWVMSCRVFKRTLEYAVFDTLVAQLRARGVRELWASYVPSGKNGPVAGLYKELGFIKMTQEPEEAQWFYPLKRHKPKTSYVDVNTRHG